MVLSYILRTRPDCKIESFYTTGRQKKIDRLSVDGFCSRCITVFASTNFVPAEISAHLSLKKISTLVVWKENSMN